MNSEFAIIGHAFDNRDDYEALMAEFTPDHFTNSQTRSMFQIMQNVVESGRKPRFDDLTKDMFQAAMMAYEASKSSLDHEIDFANVRKQYHKQQYRRMADMLTNLVSGDFDLEAAEDVISRFMPYSKEETNKDYMVTAEEAGELALKEFEERLESGDEIPGIALSYKNDKGETQGFKSLDDVLYGLQGGDLIMIAAQSGHGKTALAMNLTRIISFHNGKFVYYLNTEMNKVDMVNRWAAMATRIDYSWIQRPKMMLPVQRDTYRKWVKTFQKSPIFVSRIPSLSPNLAKALIKRAKGKKQIDCVIVDYVGRMSLESTRHMQEWQIMSSITQQLKEMAQELNIPIIALAQLNADGHLEGARKMRNECDGLFFFKPKKIDDETNHDTDYVLIKEKVRRGSTEGAINCEFYKPYQFIREV